MVCCEIDDDDDDVLILMRACTHAPQSAGSHAMIDASCLFFFVLFSHFLLDLVEKRLRNNLKQLLMDQLENKINIAFLCIKALFLR